MKITSFTNTPDASSEGRELLDEMVRQGVQRIISQALEAELEDWLAARRHLRDEKQRALVTRNGHHRARVIQTASGPVSIAAPRAHDHRGAEQGREKYLSKLLPPYLRRTASLDALIPALYLKGISTGEMSAALAPILGAEAENLSPNVIAGLTKSGVTGL